MVLLQNVLKHVSMTQTLCVRVCVCTLNSSYLKVKSHLCSSKHIVGFRLTWDFSNPYPLDKVLELFLDLCLGVHVEFSCSLNV